MAASSWGTMASSRYGVLSGLENEKAPASSWPMKTSRPSADAARRPRQRVGLDRVDDRRLTGDPHQHVAVEAADLLVAGGAVEGVAGQLVELLRRHQPEPGHQPRAAALPA